MFFIFRMLDVAAKAWIQLKVLDPTILAFEFEVGIDCKKESEEKPEVHE